MEKNTHQLAEFLLWAAIALGLVFFVIKPFIIQPFYVKGASMEPNFFDGQYLVVDELSYRFNAPTRGEVIVFRYPYDTTQYYIKRIIGLPGELVEIKDSKIIIYNKDNPNGFTLTEDYILSKEIPGSNIQKNLGEDEYFVLGDHRTASSDSRFWGALNKKFIVGKAWLRLWPPQTLEVFASPNYIK